jgi:hypothetical protein
MSRFSASLGFPQRQPSPRQGLPTQLRGGRWHIIADFPGGVVNEFSLPFSRSRFPGDGAAGRAVGVRSPGHEPPAGLLRCGRGPWGSALADKDGQHQEERPAHHLS